MPPISSSVSRSRSWDARRWSANTPSLRNAVWRDLNFVQTVGDDYAKDLGILMPDGSEYPALVVFKRDGDKVRLFWASEMTKDMADTGQGLVSEVEVLKALPPGPMSSHGPHGLANCASPKEFPGPARTKRVTTLTPRSTMATLQIDSNLPEISATAIDPN